MGGLQDLNYEEYTGVWDRYLRMNSSVVIPDIEAIRQTDFITYDCLKSSISTPLWKRPCIMTITSPATWAWITIKNRMRRT